MEAKSWGKEFLFSRAIGTAKMVFAEKTGLLPKDVDNLAIIPFRDVGFSIIAGFVQDTLIEGESLILFPKMTVQDLAHVALAQVLRDLRPPTTLSSPHA